MNDTVPGTVDGGNLNEKRRKVGVGKPAKFYVPLPLREGSPKDVSGQYIFNTGVLFREPKSVFSQWLMADCANYLFRSDTSSECLNMDIASNLAMAYPRNCRWTVASVSTSRRM